MLMFFSCTGLLSEPESNKTRLILFSHLIDGVRDASSNLHNVSGGQQERTYERGNSTSETRPECGVSLILEAGRDGTAR